MTDETLELIHMYAEDILNSDTYKIQKIYPHHRRVNVYEHELHVTEIAINLARNSEKDINMRTLIRAAMLHDYYLYDWHYGRKWHRWHAYKHPRIAAENAGRDFGINEDIKNAILTHMWPLTLRMPKTTEAKILSKADKIATFRENFHKNPLD